MPSIRRLRRRTRFPSATGRRLRNIAAIFYHRAIEMILEARRVGRSTEGKRPTVITDDQAVSEWISGPLTSVPLDQARGCLDRNRRALHEAELGARRQSCGWEFDSR